jgi:DNA-binding transcriptional MerR regulator
MERGKYKIKTVAELTGFSPTRLRAWERRYDFLQPGRNQSPHRLYTESDLQLLLSIKRLLDRGQSIGEVAALGRAQLLQGVSPQHLGGPAADEICAPLSQDLEATLRGLVAPNWRRRQVPRWAGENLGVSLHDLSQADLVTVLRVYQIVHEYYELWLYGREQPPLEVLRRSLEPLRDAQLGSAVKRLGQTLPDTASSLLRSALRDCREGALGPLLSICQSHHLKYEQLQTCALLARDQAKLMRNAIYDLDPPLSEADISFKAHAFKPTLEKLNQVFALECASSFEGAISCRCLETSALDRVLYDFVQRAPRPEAIYALEVNHLIRIAIPAADRKYGEDDLPTQAVALALGVSPQQALRDQLIAGNSEWSWFHWPIFEPPEGADICNCRL